MLVTSKFSFSHSVFKRLVLQTRKNQGLFGKGLRVSILWLWIINILSTRISDIGPLVILILASFQQKMLLLLVTECNKAELCGRGNYRVMTVPSNEVCYSKPFTSFPNDKFWTAPKSKSLQTTISNWTKMGESFLNR